MDYSKVQEMIVTENDLFQMYAPAFNFELDAPEIVIALMKEGLLVDLNNGSYRLTYMGDA
jgi:hypothetical protein